LLIMTARAARVAVVSTALAALLIAAAPAHALDPRKAITQYVYEAWGTRDGLPVFSVNAVTRTPDGYLWVGTEAGLLRFDGVRFTLIDPRRFPELRAEVLSLLTDRAGTLWIGTDRGLVRWQHGVTRHYSPANGLAGDRVLSLYEDRDGVVWVATRSGLSRIDAGRVTSYTTREGLPNDIIQSITQAPDGTMWIATNGGLARLRQGRFSTLTTKDGLPNDLVQSVYADRHGAVWAGTWTGLARIDRDGRMTRDTTAEGLSHDLVNEIVEDDAGSLWFSTYGGGLTRYRDGRVDRFMVSDGLSADFLNTVFLDRDGSLWVAMHHGGLGRLRDGLVTPYTVHEGLPNDSVRVVMQDRAGAMWIGTHGGGLARWADGRITATFTTRDGLPSDLAFALAEDSLGRLWVSTYNGGLSRWEGGRFRTIVSEQLARNQFITAMQEDRGGAMWLGTFGGGLKRMVGDQITTFTHRDGLADDSIITMAMDAAGTVWIGTWKGLTRYADGRFTTLTPQEGMPDDEVVALLADTDGSLWVASEHGGLTRVKNGRVTRIEPARPLFDDTVLGIVADDRGYLWCSSNRGIYRVARQELHDFAEGRRTSVHVIRYDAADGMKTQECNGGTQPAGWRARNGTLWFPTQQGVVTIDPARLRTLPTPPPSIVEAMVVDGATLVDTLAARPAEPATAVSTATAATAGDTARGTAPIVGPLVAPVVAPIVQPGSRQVEFHYTAPYLIAPARVRFRYRLDGYDSTWVEAGARRIAYYTDLPPGAHTFRVTAAIDDGPWSEQEGLLAVQVAPRFYQTWWFPTVICAAIGGALWGAHRYRVDQLLAIERVRTRIASDLHDDIGSSLSQIAILSEVVRARVSPAPEAIADPLARIGTLSRESVDAMGDIVWAISPQSGTPIHLSQRMRRLASDLLPARGIQLQFESVDAGADRLGMETRREVFLIFKEALNNIVRHAGATTTTIKLAIDRRALRLVVTDNGAGFVVSREASGASAVGGQGLRSMTRRAAAIGGRLSIASTPGVGTTITLDAPVR
jgi:ligand-binding sensor domain-containing protein/signal transduction histidine kinase